MSKAESTPSSARAPRHLAVLAVAAGLLVQSGCSSAACPSKAEDLRDAALRERIGADFAAGTAVVHRYVDSPDAEFRGYDISITQRVAGLAEADQVMFVRIDEPIPNIELGTEVLVVGRRGPKAAEIQPAGCPVLVPAGP